MSPSLQTNLQSGTVIDYYFYFFSSKKWNIFHHGFSVFTVSLLAVLHVILTNNANAKIREVLKKGVFDIWLKMEMNKVFSVSSP